MMCIACIMSLVTKNSANFLFHTWTLFFVFHCYHLVLECIKSGKGLLTSPPASIYLMYFLQINFHMLISPYSQLFPAQKEINLSRSNRKFQNIIGLEFKAFLTLSSNYFLKSSPSFFLVGF